MPCFDSSQCSGCSACNSNTCNGYSCCNPGNWINDYCRNELAKYDCIGFDLDCFPCGTSCSYNPCSCCCPYCGVCPPGPHTPQVGTNFLSSVNTSDQTIAAGAALSFTAERASNGTCIQHTPGSSVFTLAGPGVYLVTVNVSASLTTVTVPAEVSISLTENGGTIPGTQSSSTITAVGQNISLGTTTIVTVPECTVSSLSVTNTSAVPITVSNANISIVKIG